MPPSTDESEGPARHPTGVREELFGADTFDRGALNAEIFARIFGKPSEELLETLGRYEILRQLGAGGMGVVYLARDPELDRKVAVKLLKASDTTDSSTRARRLRREARSMARLTHPHVVQVYEMGRHDDHWFIAMEYVEGTTLSRWLSAEPRTWRQVLGAFVDAGRGLAAAHDAQMVHRDFKPDNVLVSAAGVVKVTDFGIATPERAAGITSRSARLPAGTARYMSAEQLLGHDVEARSDQFSFCVSLLEALLGEHPFEASSVGALTAAIIGGTRRPLPARPGVPRWVLDTVVRGLAREPDERWPSMSQLLDRLCDDPAVHRRRWLTGGALALAAGGLAWTVKGSTPDDPCPEGSAQATQTWTTEREQRIDQQFRSLALPYAESSQKVLQHRMEGWSEGWAQAYSDVCQARHEMTEGRYEVRMGCLQQQRQQVDALLDQLEIADTELVARVPVVSESIPRPEACSDAQPLQGVEPPAPEATADVAQLRRTLAELEALALTNRVDADAMDRLDALEVRATAVGYRPLMAEVALQRHAIEEQRGTADGTALLRAHALALESGYESLAIESAIRLIRGPSSDDAPPAVIDYAREHWNALATALLARAPDDINYEIARRSANIDAIQRAHGPHHDSVDEHTQAQMDLVQRTIGLDDKRALKTLGLRARFLVNSHRSQEALEVIDRITAIHDRWYGPSHPLRINELLARCMALMNMGRLDEAQRVADRAYAIIESSPSPREDLARIVYARFAEFQDRQGRHERARMMYEKLFDEAVPTAERMRGATDVGIANSYCFVLYQLDHFDRAEAVCSQVLSASERLWPKGHMLSAIALNNLGLIARGRGQAEDGLAFDRRALAICEEFDVPNHACTAYALVGIGEGLLLLGRADEALPALQRALQLRRSLPHAAELGEVECLLARARGSLDAADPEARALAEAGLARLRKDGLAWKRQVRACEPWQARP